MEEDARCYWINVATSTYRADCMKTQLERLGESNVQVDAYTPTTIPIRTWSSNSYQMSPSEIACTYSHLKAMQTALKERPTFRHGEFFLVMEDDIVIPWKYNWDAVSLSAPLDWDILQLSVINPSRVISLYRMFVHGQLFAPRVNEDWGTACYMIRYETARKIVELYSQGLYAFEPMGPGNYSAPLADNLVYSRNKVYISTIPLLFCQDKDSLIHEDHLSTHRRATKCVVSILRRFFTFPILRKWVIPRRNIYTPIGGYRVIEPTEPVPDLFDTFGISYLPSLDSSGNPCFEKVGPGLIRYGIRKFEGKEGEYRIVLANEHGMILSNPWVLWSHEEPPVIPPDMPLDRIVDAPCFLFSQRWDNNYRHFLLETLGHLVEAKKLVDSNPKALVAVLESNYPEYVRFAVETMIPKERLVFIPDDQVWGFSKAVFVSGHANPVHEEFVANEMIRRATCSIGSFSRIFLDRKTCDEKVSQKQHFHGRRVLNKELLYSVLHSSNLTTIEPGTIPYHEQLYMVNQADLIACEISAACDNIRFCKPGATFVILYPQNLRGWAGQYESIARIRGVRLKLVCCGIPDQSVYSRDPWNYPWVITDLTAFVNEIS